MDILQNTRGYAGLEIASYTMFAKEEVFMKSNLKFLSVFWIFLAGNFGKNYAQTLENLFQNDTWIVPQSNCYFEWDDFLNDSHYNYKPDSDDVHLEEFKQKYRSWIDQYLKASILFGLNNLAKNFPELSKSIQENILLNPVKIDCVMALKNKTDNESLLPSGTYEAHKKMITVRNLKRHLITNLRWELYCPKSGFSCAILKKEATPLDEFSLKQWFLYLNGQMDKSLTDTLIHEYFHHHHIDNREPKVHNTTLPFLEASGSFFDFGSDTQQVKLSPSQCRANREAAERMLKDTVYACAAFASLDKFLIERTVANYSCETNMTAEQKEFGIMAYWWEVCRTCKTATINSKQFKREERFALFPQLDAECKELAQSLNRD